MYPDNVVSLNDYKRKKGIALPRSPYSSLDATREQVRDACQRAAEALNQDARVYAAVIGYENQKTGKIKLLKGLRLFSSKELLESTAGIKGYNCICLIKRNPFSQKED